MDITKFGAENAEKKQIAREHNPKYMNKTIIRQMRQRRELQQPDIREIGKGAADTSFVKQSQKGDLISMSTKKKNIIE